jgi:hypothetical protein
MINFRNSKIVAMISLFHTPYNSAILIALTISYGIAASITTLDIRIIQAKKNGTLPAQDPSLPSWVAIIYWLEWLIFIIMVLLNWQFAIIVFVAKFILKVLPVLEIVGNFIMSPFKPKR